MPNGRFRSTRNRLLLGLVRRDEPGGERDSWMLSDQKQHAKQNEEYGHFDIHCNVPTLPEDRNDTGDQEERPDHDTVFIQSAVHDEGQ